MARRLMLVVDIVALPATVPITFSIIKRIDPEDHDSDIRPIIIWGTYNTHIYHKVF